MASGAAGVGIVAAWIPDPTVSKIVAAGAGALAMFASDALGRNKCVKVVLYGHIPPLVPQQYSGKEAGRYCK